MRINALYSEYCSLFSVTRFDTVIHTAQITNSLFRDCPVFAASLKAVPDPVFASESLPPILVRSSSSQASYPSPLLFVAVRSFRCSSSPPQSLTTLWGPRFVANFADGHITFSRSAASQASYPSPLRTRRVSLIPRAHAVISPQDNRGGFSCRGQSSG